MELFTRSRMLRGAMSPLNAVTVGLAGTLVLALLAQKGEVAATPGTLAFGILVAFPLTIASGVDAACHILPDPLLLIAGALALAHASLKGANSLVHAGAAAVLALALGYALNRAASLGMGDVKLLGVIALWLGSLRLTLAAATLAMAAAGAYSLVLMAVRRATRTTSIALGPWLSAGAGLAWAATLA